MFFNKPHIPPKNISSPRGGQCDYFSPVLQFIPLSHPVRMEGREGMVTEAE